MKTTSHWINFSVVALDQRSGPRLTAAENALDDIHERTSLELRYAFSLLYWGADFHKRGEHSLKVLKIGKILSPTNGLFILLQVL